MPRRAPTETSKRRPDPDSLFTDRERECGILETILEPTPTPPDQKEKFLTVFYGVGGVGKSALVARAREIGSKWKNVTLVHIDFDTSGWAPESPFVIVAREFVRAVAGEGIAVPLSTCLLTLHSLYSKPSGDTDSKEAEELAIEIIGKSVELAKHVPVVNLGVKVGEWIWKEERRRQVEIEVRDLGMWPASHGGRIDLIDLEGKIALALFEDLRNFMGKHKKRHVRLLVDGFDRLQSFERRIDAQLRIQQVLGYCAVSTARSRFDRFRVVMLSREKLRWDALYEKDWGDHCRQHHLTGLTEPHAREYLARWSRWFSRDGQDAGAHAIATHEDAILRASTEAASEAPAYSPYCLSLAVDLAERSATDGLEPDFGNTPAELQLRFVKYLSRAECRALMVLALAGVFDSALFDWLAQQRMVEYAAHSFDSALRQEHSYFLPAGDGTWRFHRVFERVLQSLWTIDETMLRECRAVILHLLSYFAAPLLQVPDRDWTETEIKAWIAGMEVLTAQGFETGVLSLAEWNQLISAPPWSSDSYKCAEPRLAYQQRVLAIQERREGIENPQTIEIARDVAFGLMSTGNWATAEPLIRRTLESAERLLGPDHPTTIISVSDLAALFQEKWDWAAAEPLYRRALQYTERSAGPEDPDTLTMLNNLAGVVLRKGDHTAAEPLYRRVLETRERVLGHEHPHTLQSVHNLACLLNAKGELANAAQLFRRAIAARERVLGLEHPDTLASVSDLAAVVWAEGDLAAAEPLSRRAMDGRERVLGRNHSHTLTSVNNLAAVLEARGDRAHAGPLYRRAVETSERVKGRDHPETLASVSNLAIFLLCEGDLVDSERFFRRALEGRERILGAAHPDTISGANSIAVFVEAASSTAPESLVRLAMESCDRVLGRDNLHTARLAGMLASLLARRGDRGASEAVLRRYLL